MTMRPLQSVDMKKAIEEREEEAADEAPAAKAGASLCLFLQRGLSLGLQQLLA